MKVLQPWSPILCQSSLPEEILSCLQILAENILNNSSSPSAGNALVGQIEQEYFVDHQKMKEAKTRTRIWQNVIEVHLKYESLLQCSYRFLFCQLCCS